VEMRWSTTSGREVGWLVAAGEVAGGEDKAVAVRMGAPAGVIEMLVGVELAFWGTWHASMPRMSKLIIQAM